MNFSGVGQESVSESQGFNLSLDTDRQKNLVGDDVFKPQILQVN